MTSNMKIVDSIFAIAIMVLIIVNIIIRTPIIKISQTPQNTIDRVFDIYRPTGVTHYMKVAKKAKEQNQDATDLYRVEFNAVAEAMKQDGIHVDYNYIEWIIEKVEG